MRCVPCVNAQSNSFSFDEDFSDTRIDHGAQILTRERQVRLLVAVVLRW